MVSSMEYDFIGRVEEMDVWGMPLLQRTGLYNASLNGWGRYQNSTFFSNKGQSATKPRVSK